MAATMELERGLEEVERGLEEVAMVEEATAVAKMAEATAVARVESKGPCTKNRGPVEVLSSERRGQKKTIVRRKESVKRRPIRAEALYKGDGGV